MKLRVLAYLSRRLTGELIGQEGIRRPSTVSKTNIFEAREPILIKFYVNHHWVCGLIALGFETDCIKIVVSMTESSHRLTMGET